MRNIIAAALVATVAVPAAAQLATTAQQPGQPAVARVAAGTYQVDAAHTQVTWEVNHMGFSMLQGQFGASGGSITIDPTKPAAAKVDVTFAIDQLSVTSSKFAEHLKSKDFFDAAANPTARFVSTAVTPRGPTRATVQGDLTIKGVTKPVTLDVTFVGAGDNPMSKKTNFGFTGTGMIKRSDFGLGYATPLVSDDVKLTVQAAFTA